MHLSLRVKSLCMVLRNPAAARRAGGTGSARLYIISKMSLFVLCVQQEALLRLGLLWETRPGQKILVLVGCGRGEGGCNVQPTP